jgi:ribose 5-phosphate isomerase B
MKIAIGSDHAGYHYKEKIKKFLKEHGHEFLDFGTDSDKPVDYPLFIRPVAEAVAKGEYDRGIVLGGSGNGEAMVANRIPGVRCALCWNIESAKLSRQHNDANMLSLGARMISKEGVLEIVKGWLDTAFDGGRHLRRIKQIDQKQTSVDHPRRSKNGETTADKEKPRIPKGGSKKPPSDKYDLLISFRYIKYMEGKKFIEFQVEPGLKRPSIVYIPSQERWNSELPEWSKNRRDEIIDRVKSKCVHMNCEWREY